MKRRPKSPRRRPKKSNVPTERELALAHQTLDNAEQLLRAFYLDRIREGCRAEDLVGVVRAHRDHFHVNVHSIARARELVRRDPAARTMLDHIERERPPLGTIRVMLRVGRKTVDAYIYTFTQTGGSA